METRGLEADPVVQTDRRRALAEALLSPLQQPGANPFMLEKYTAFAKEWRESGSMRQLFLDGLLSSISDFNEAIGNADDFLPFILPLDQRDQVEITMARQRSAGTGAY